MAQINLHTTPDFEADLEALMRARGIRTKSEAIRVAVKEAAPKREAKRPRGDLTSLIGLIDRLPGPRLTEKTSEEVLKEIDDEMEAKLDRLSRRGDRR